jgi:membrane protein
MSMFFTLKHWLRNKVETLKVRVCLVIRTVQELGADDASHMAAGVSYYAIFSLFPLTLALLAILGIFLPSETLQEEIFCFFERNLPGTVDVIKENIEQVIQLRGTIGAVGVALLLWTASAMFGAVSRTINRAWDVHQDRPFHKQKMLELGMALSIGLLFFLSLGTSQFFSLLRDTDLPIISRAFDGASSIFSTVRGMDIRIMGGALEVGASLTAFLPSLAIFMILYKFAPNTKTYWRYIWPGALLAAILFEIAKSIFILYLDRFATYDLVYGSIASVIALLFWIYVSAFVLILGAEFSAEYGRMRMGIARGICIETPDNPVERHIIGLEETGDAEEQISEYSDDQLIDNHK